MLRIFMTLISLLFFAGIAQSADLNGLARIKDFKVASSSEEIRVAVKASGDISPPSTLTVVNDRLLQVDIEKSYTEPAKRSFTVGDSFLDKVDIYQLDKDTVRMRFHLLSPFKKGAGDVWMDEGGFVISLKRSGAATEKATSRSDSKIEASFPAIFGGSGVPAAEGDLLDTSEEKSDSNPVVRMGASLALVLGIFLLGSYLFREKVLKKGAMGKGKLIRVLDRGFVDVKKGIAIVDVAGEILVLGISGEGITMLTKLESESALERLKPMYKGDNKGSFSDAINMASGKAGGERSAKMIDKIKSLKPLR